MRFFGYFSIVIREVHITVSIAVNMSILTSESIHISKHIAFVETWRKEAMLNSPCTYEV